MDFGSLPHYPGGSDDGFPDPEPLPDRRSWEYAVGALLAAAVVGFAVLWFVLRVLLSGGVPEGPVFA